MYKTSLPVFMWLISVLFFTYQFILRLFPGLMMNQIMERFSIDATSFGLLAAFYYYGYSGMQIPIAILLDRLGARFMLSICAIICGLGALMFLYTDNFYCAIASRFIIGASSSIGFLGTSKIISQWFSVEKYAKMVGLSFSVGLMGAIYGGRPVTLMIEEYGAHLVSFIIAITSIIIGIIVYIFLRAPKNIDQNEYNNKTKITFKDIKFLFTYKKLWYLAIANLLMVGTLEGFADVWGVPYLMIAHNLKKSDAAGLISLVFVGMIFGGPILAYLSKKIKGYYVIAICGTFMVLAFIYLLSNAKFNYFILNIVFFVIGIMCCYQVIVFDIGITFVDKKYISITVAFLNSINMLGGSFFHSIIGKVMDVLWLGEKNTEGFKIYDLIVYKYSLCVIPICAFIGVLIVLFISNNKKIIVK